MKSNDSTDIWPWSKIIKYTLLPKPKGSPRIGKKEILVRIVIATIFIIIALILK